MSNERAAALERAARRERQAAKLLSTYRVRHRDPHEAAPDCHPVFLPCGVTLAPEVKTRKRLPALITKALAQAASYARAGSVPVAILSATGEEPVIVLPLRAFRIIAGLSVGVEGPQLDLFAPPPEPDFSECDAPTSLDASFDGWDE